MVYRRLRQLHIEIPLCENETYIFTVTKSEDSPSAQRPADCDLNVFYNVTHGEENKSSEQQTVPDSFDEQYDLSETKMQTGWFYV